MKLDKLDILFSEFVRRRTIKEVGGCERCLTLKYDILKDDGKIFPAWKQLQCSHFWGRTKRSTRFDENDAAGLCGACHIYFSAHPQEHAEFFKKRLGQRAYDMLEIRANTPQKIDENAVELYLKAKLKELENG